MASSALHNPQQSQQKESPHIKDAIGTGAVKNSSLGTGSGKVINPTTGNGSSAMGSKKKG